MGGHWVPNESPSIMQLFHAIIDAPLYHLALEGLLLIWVFWLIFRRSYNPKEKAPLTEKEKDDLIEEWQPEPLVPRNSPSFDPDHPALNPRIIQSKIGKYMVVKGRKCLNVSTHDYLCMNEEPSVEDASVKSLEQFGVGACGPRAFYGTAGRDVKSFACFVLGVRFKLNPKKAKVTRRFLVVEGIYMNTGDLCPLPKIVELRRQFKVRLFVDESISFGTLGKTGRGIFEHYGIPNSEADLITGTLEYVLSSVGGFCVGTSFIVDNQRISGHGKSSSGYCFSAALPPLLAAGALAALEYIESSRGIAAIERLRRNCLQAQVEWGDVPGMELVGDAVSPVKHLQFKDRSENRKDDSRALQEMVAKVRGPLLAFFPWMLFSIGGEKKKRERECNHLPCFFVPSIRGEQAEEMGVALTSACYVEDEDVCMPPPSIRLVVSSALDDGDIRRVADVLRRSAPRRGR
ncbi:unnamed protein product [Darwinula stevensoni]|uniref:Serine palmitoyltransferase 1 n=1 Tax=Darwinula stevensoni TaxID=69355 RepID=A0A7R8X1P8_9CRUS|nr:unnamed protein product [Darwinula stevensoni]CAG0882427.1 unnamed protein product [Darwinula stevensoni]